MPTLLLLRHAEAEDFRPGHPDLDRRLTERGVGQAQAVGEFVREQEISIDYALCSVAERTRQTLAALGLSCPTEFAKAIYNAPSDTILNVVRELDDSINIALIVGHSPGIPALVHDLADETSDPMAVQLIDHRYPPATLSALVFDNRWAELIEASLRWARLDH